MNSWLNFATSFAELSSGSGETVLQLQFGDGTEEWSLEGGLESTQQRFLQLSRRAGQALVDVHLFNHETGSAIDPEIRWFRLLRERNNPSDSSPVVIDSVGVAISSWTLADLGRYSSELCRELQSTNPIQKDSSWLVKKLREDRIGTVLKLTGAMLLALVLLRLLLR